MPLPHIQDLSQWIQMLDFIEQHEENHLLGLVPESAGLVRASRPRDANNGRMLAVLPAPHPLKEPHHIRLLLPPQLRHILVRPCTIPTKQHSSMTRRFNWRNGTNGWRSRSTNPLITRSSKLGLGFAGEEAESWGNGEELYIYEG